jgi:hypothetical protein
MTDMKLVLVGYTPSKTVSALQFCGKAFSKLPLTHRLLVWNGSKAVGCVPKGWEVLQGSNSMGEFSGWQEGLDHLRKSGSEDSVIFANDTIASHRRFSVFRRWALVREIWCANPRCIVGFTDHANNDIGELRICGLVLPGWTSTYCFMLGRETLDRLAYQLYDPDVVDRCVSGGVEEETFVSAELSPDLQLQLRRWLFRGGWYKSAPLSASNEAMFKFKARAICAELLLSARCWASGCTRHDPFERHPLARTLDRRTEGLARRLWLTRGEWVAHPLPWRERQMERVKS